MKLRLLIVIAVLILAAAPADARRPGLLMYGNVQQALTFSYEFENSESETENTSRGHQSHLAKQKYTLLTDYAIYNPLLWKGRASAGLIFSEGLSSSTTRDDTSSTSWGINYDISGIFFEKFPHPLSFYVRSETSSVLRDFGGSYDMTSDGYGVAFRFLNDYVPIGINYNSSTTTTSGLGRDRVQYLQSISFSATHQIPNLSTTSLSVARSVSENKIKGSEFGSSKYITERGTLTNTISWTSGRNVRSVSLSGGATRESGDLSGFSWFGGGGFLWEFGRALSLRGDATNNRLTSPTRNDKTGRLLLQHRLFESISTTGGLLYRRIDVDEGSEQEKSVSYSVAYQKKLPLNGNLSLGYAETFGKVQRSGVQTIRFQTFEGVASFTEPIIITLPGAEIDNLKVFNRNPEIPATDKPLIEFEEGVDFFADTLTGDLTIFIDPTGAISEGERIFIIFRVIVDPNLQYDSHSRGINASLSLWGPRLRLYGNLQEATQTERGKRTSATLGSSRALEVGVQHTAEAGTFDASYATRESEEETSRSVQGSFSKSFYFQTSALTLYLRERMAWRKAKQDLGPNSNRRDNALSVGVQYNRTIRNNVELRLRTNYLNVRGRLNTDNVSFLGTLQISIGRVFVEVQPEFHWIKTGSSTEMDQKISLMITRYF